MKRFVSWLWWLWDKNSDGAICYAAWRDPVLPKEVLDALRKLADAESRPAPETESPLPEKTRRV